MSHEDIYSVAEVERFLLAVDAALSEPASVTVIGGAAALLHYGVLRTTRDVDTFTTIPPHLRTAIELARRTTGLTIPFEKSGVADAPFEFESRLERVLPQLQRLIVHVPERHDFALIKVLRGDPRDIGDIESVHQHFPLDCDLLVSRFESEMSHVVMEPTRLRGNFLYLISRLFPQNVDDVARGLRRPAKTPSVRRARASARHGTKRRRR